MTDSTTEQALNALAEDRAHSIEAGKTPKRYPPQCSETLGFELISLDKDTGVARVRYDGKEAFTNPAGFIQGGFLSAMIDDVIGMICSIKLAKKGVPSTIDLHLHYLRPVRPGPIEVEAKISNMGRTVVFTEAQLFDPRGKVAVRATSSLAIVKGR